LKPLLTVAEAAEYLGVSAQTLRRWDKDGVLRPTRHPVNGYRLYELSNLEPFRVTVQNRETSRTPITEFFATTVANIEANELLREPQRDAHRAAREHFEKSRTPIILQLPVGCGKTGSISVLPFGIAHGRVLVIAPNLTIRRGISEALDVSAPGNFLAKARVLESLKEGPFSAVLEGDSANIHDCNESHFVVTNIQQLASSADKWLPQFSEDYFDMILVDEGHHNAAPSWRKVFERFPNAKVVSLTATPFRADRKELSGDVVYRYPFARAMMQGYIKQILSVNVAPAKITFTYRGDERTHSLEEVLELREEDWFSKGVALAPECNKHIVEASIQRCESMRRRTGIKHQIIAAACSVDHARQIRHLFEEHNYVAREIHSEMSEDEQSTVFAQLRADAIDCIVHVQMLGEGFDHPKLSVAAVFRPFRSLSPYIQFAGRIMRVVHQNLPGHADNQGFVVSHLGLNNDQHWTEFRELDLEDQAILQHWLRDSDEVDDFLESGGGEPRRFDSGMLQVEEEILSHFIGQAFLDPNDDRVLSRLLGQPLGATGLKVGDVISKDVLRSRLQQQQQALELQPVELPVSPQKRRRSARSRLHERTNSVVSRVLKDLGLSMPGRELSRVFKSAPYNNRQVLTTALNRKINEFLGIARGQRGTLTAANTEAALSSLDVFGDELCSEIRAKLKS
jgi:DNA repair protein RadD